MDIRVTFMSQQRQWSTELMTYSSSDSPPGIHYSLNYHRFRILPEYHQCTGLFLKNYIKAPNEMYTTDVKFCTILQ